MTDRDYMKMALDLALRAKGQASPNPVVGAVVVKSKSIIATGYHRRCGADHAEVAALKKAGDAAKGAKLYVTLEPCSHYGRTPPCVDKIIRSGIKEVIIGMVDPNPVNNGRSITKLRKAGIKTKVGFLKEELQKANESFIKFIAHKAPFVVVKWAQTIDGKIATKTGQSRWITSRKTRDFAHDLRNDFDAILVGIHTVLKDNPHLNATKKTKKIKKVIADTFLRISPRANIFKNTDPGNIFLATSKEASLKKIEEFRKRGVNVLICPQARGYLDFKWLFIQLARRAIASILIEGGSEVIGSALKARLVDKAMIFIAPKAMGDREAIGSIGGFNIKHVNQAIQLKDINVSRIGQDILVEGYIG